MMTCRAQFAGADVWIHTLPMSQVCPASQARCKLVAELLGRIVKHVEIKWLRLGDFPGEKKNRSGNERDVCGTDVSSHGGTVGGYRGKYQTSCDTNMGDSDAVQ